MHRNISEAKKIDIKLWFTDLDGSFAVEGIIPTENRNEAIKFLESHPERKIVIGSGRAPSSTMSVVINAGLEKYVHENKIHISGYNGGLTYLNNKIIHNQPFSSKVSEDLQIVAYNKNIIATFYGKNKLFQGRHSEQSELYTNFLNMPLEYFAINLSEDMYMAEFVKPHNVSLQELRKIVISPENEKLINAYSFTTPFRDVDQNMVFFQTNPKGVNKALAVRAYIDALNLKPENVLVSGDAPNDVSSLNVEGVTSIIFKSKYNAEIIPKVTNPETFLASEPSNGAWKEIADKIIKY